MTMQTYIILTGTLVGFTSPCMRKATSSNPGLGPAPKMFLLIWSLIVILKVKEISSGNQFEHFENSEVLN